MDWKFRQALKYINWRKEAERVPLNKKEFETLLNDFSKNRQKAISMTIRGDFDESTYTYSEKGYWRYIYCVVDNQYKIYSSHKLDDKRNERAKDDMEKGIISDDGYKSKIIMEMLFKKHNQTTLLRTYGYCDRPMIWKCIPRPLYYINKAYSNKELSGVSKADYSSNYPSRLLGKLPDWHGHKEIEGTVSPTEEYPFAFYVRSGHSAEYNNYDTHNWLSHVIGRELFSDEKFDDTITADKDLTILCKAATITLDSVIQELYDAKCRNEKINGIEAKLVLNSTIGYMHRKDLTNNSYRLDHLACVVICRANQLMMDTYDNIVRYNIPVLQIIVDGIIYKSPVKFGVDKKSIGALVQEFTNERFMMQGINQYMFRDKDNKLLEAKHGAFNANIKTDSFEDMKEWRKE